MRARMQDARALACAQPQVAAPESSGSSSSRSDASAVSQTQPTRKQRLDEWKRQKKQQQQDAKPLPPPFRPTAAATSTTTPSRAKTVANRSRPGVSRPRTASIASSNSSKNVPRVRLAERKHSTIMAPPVAKRSASVSSSGSTDTANGSEELHQQPSTPTPPRDTTSRSPLPDAQNSTLQYSPAAVAAHSVVYRSEIEHEQPAARAPLHRVEPPRGPSVPTDVFDNFYECAAASPHAASEHRETTRHSALPTQSPPRAAPPASSHLSYSASSAPRSSNGDLNDLQRMLAYSESVNERNAAVQSDDHADDEDDDAGDEDAAASRTTSQDTHDNGVKRRDATSSGLDARARNAVSSDGVDAQAADSDVTQTRDGPASASDAPCDAIEMAVAAVSATRVAVVCDSDDANTTQVVVVTERRTTTVAAAAAVATETAPRAVRSPTTEPTDNHKYASVTSSASNATDEQQDAADELRATTEASDATHAPQPPLETQCEASAADVESPKQELLSNDAPPTATRKQQRNWVASLLVPLSVALVCALAWLAWLAPDSFKAPLTSLLGAASTALQALAHAVSDCWHALSARVDTVALTVAHVLTSAAAALKSRVAALGTVFATAAHAVQTRATAAIDALYDRVLPSADDSSARVLDATRTQLLEPFDTDQRALHATLEAQLQQHETWARAELERLKAQRAAHAAATDALLADTRAVVRDGLRDAQAAAARHIDACAVAASDELADALARELSAYEQQEATDTDDMIVTTRKSRARDIAQFAERESAQLRADFERVATDVTTQLAHADHALRDAVAGERELASVADDARAALDDEDAALLRELDAFTEREAERIAVEQQRTLDAAAATAQHDTETLQLEREHVEWLAQALADEQQQVAAEHERQAAAIAASTQQAEAALVAERARVKAATHAAAEHARKRIDAQTDAARAELERKAVDVAAHDRAAAAVMLHEAEAIAAVAEFAVVDDARDALAQLDADAETLRAAVADVRPSPVVAASAGEFVHVATVVETSADAPLLDDDVAAAIAAVATATASDLSELPSPSLPEAPVPAVEGPTVMPRFELVPLALVSTVFVALAIATAVALRTRRRRQLARASNDSRRFQQTRRRAESDDIEEVVLFATATTVTSVVETESRSPSSTDELDEEASQLDDGVDDNHSSVSGRDDSDAAESEQRERHAVLRRRTRRITTRRTLIVSEREDAPPLTS